MYLRLDRIEAAGLASINSIKGQHAVITKLPNIGYQQPEYVMCAFIMYDSNFAVLFLVKTVCRLRCNTIAYCMHVL